jgi:hypothetical protein
MMMTITSTQSTTTPYNKPSEAVTDDVPLSTIQDDESSTTVLSVVTSINTFNSPQIFSTSSPNDDYTNPIIILPSPGHLSLLL